MVHARVFLVHMSKLGPKEAQIRALREAKYDLQQARKPVNLIMNPEPDEDDTAPEDGDQSQEIEPAAVVTPAKPSVEDLQAIADAVPAKRGRPAKRTPEERKALRAELMRKKRAKETKP